jgi:integrase
MDRKTVYNIFRELSESARIPSVSRSPHATRHSIGQKMAESGVNPRAIQQAAGHKSLNSTAQYFAFRDSFVESEKARALGVWD